MIEKEVVYQDIIPVDNEEFHCPVCKGKKIIFGRHFTSKHLAAHGWSEKAIDTFFIFKDTPQVQAMIARRRAESIKDPEGKPLRETNQRVAKEESDAFLRKKAVAEFDKRATELLKSAGVFQGSLEDTLKTLGLQGIPGLTLCNGGSEGTPSNGDNQGLQRTGHSPG